MLDSHCHLDSRQFNGRVDEIIQSARENNLSLIVNIGIDLKTSKRSIELAEKYTEVYATVGFHPHEAKHFTDATEREIERLLDHPKVVALGEIGLDFYRDLSPRDVQHEVFERQLAIAVRKQVPIVVHVRESFPETFEIIRRYAGKLPGAVFHCFSEGPEEARKVFDLGCIISVGGVVTYKNSKMSDVAKVAPLQRIMLETDSPYLTPTPHRGELNQPDYVRFVCQKIAELRGMKTTDVERITDTTARKFYRLAETFGD